MATAHEHYEHFLAQNYTWMLGGDVDTVAAAQTELLRTLGLDASAGNGTAIDLGCGPGPQTLALIDLGFTSVTAVDTSALLLQELRDHCTQRGVSAAVHTIHDDICGLLPRSFTPGSIAAITCMGDTITHLPSRADVRQLIADVAATLSPGGSFIISYRDLSIERHGDDRYLLVRHTADRTLTCFLDYVDQDTVMVHDELRTHSGDIRKSELGSYPKLRLSRRWITDTCHANELRVDYAETTPQGLTILHAHK